MIDLAFLKRLIEAIESSEIDTIEISRWGWVTKVRISKSPSVIIGGSAGSSAPLTVRAESNSGGNPTLAAPPQTAGEVAPAKLPGEAAAAERANLAEVSSPMVGTFYRAPAPDAEPYVDLGDRVKVGQTLCILEAMKLMNELEAEVSGTVREICVDNGEPVEYGQILFRILPDGAV